MSHKSPSDHRLRVEFMCLVCVRGSVTTVRGILESKSLCALSAWCTTARSALAHTFEDDPQLLLGGSRTAPAAVAPVARHQAARRALLVAALGPKPILGAAELLSLREFLSSDSWSFLAVAFSHYNAVRYVYHRRVCTVCDNRYVCDAWHYTPLELVSTGAESVRATTSTYLETVGLDYAAVRHVVEVDGDWFRTVLENEWATICARRAPPVDKRLGAYRRKRAFQVMLRALHKQRRVLRASKNTLALVAESVARAAIVLDREACGYNTSFKIPGKLTVANYSERHLGRSTLLVYSPHRNVFEPQHYPLRPKQPSCEQSPRAIK